MKHGVRLPEEILLGIFMHMPDRRLSERPELYLNLHQSREMDEVAH